MGTVISYMSLIFVKSFETIHALYYDEACWEHKKDFQLSVTHLHNNYNLFIGLNAPTVNISCSFYVPMNHFFVVTSLPYSSARTEIV